MFNALKWLTGTLLMVSCAYGQSTPGEFFVHAFHRKTLGSLTCTLCHVPSARGSVELKRPGHEQCKVCHQAEFDGRKTAGFCEQCHSGSGSASDLSAHPKYKGTRAVLSDFSHARHMDAKARTDPATGFRSDCTFCHKLQPDGVQARFPGHTQCAQCHAKPGVKPHLGESVSASECQGCHSPEEIENPGSATVSRRVPVHAFTGRYGNIKFSHAAHFQLSNMPRLDCTACHSAITASRSLSDLSLPLMVDCMACHDASRTIAAQYRMSNCSICHSDPVSGPAPSSHTLAVKPPSHNESFRIHHADEASAPDAKCFACHQNVRASASAKNQCVSCHEVMRPESHTARWKDDIHGKFAAIDRTTCATCHAADYCIRCHNEVPRSHQPLPLFKAGAHAQLAMLNQRACMTCHTFESTCSKCHARGLGPASPSIRK